ncbi:MAG: DNA-binding protein WhiA [Eubacteriales bacterium]|nr:DNA-binding protein WhiA [Eubacteriales bacterium]
MSFSSEIKEELSRQLSSARHCRIAEIAAILSMCGGVSISANDRYKVKIQTENIHVARKYFTLLQKTFNIGIEVSVRQGHGNSRGRIFTAVVTDQEDALRLLHATRTLEDDRFVVQNTCCKRAFLRGAFLAAGSVSDPVKFYHLEFVCATSERAELIQQLLKTFELEAKIVQRKKYFVVYLKEGDRIVDLLNVIEAHSALLKLENIRILKEMRNSVNRKVNCETANIHKTVNAAVKQLEDIRYIRDTIGFDGLSEGLAQMADIRLRNPDATLKELGLLLIPQMGKSGVNHRLRKLSEIAEELREKNHGS